MAHPLFGPEVRLLLDENDSPGIKAFCESLHPATVAEALEGHLAVEEVWRFLEQTNIRTQAMIFEYFPMDLQVQMVEGTGRQRMAKLVEQMSHDDRADLLRRLQPAVTEGLLRLVDEADRKDIASLVNYPVNSAGALMTTDYAWLPENISVGEALDRLRLQAPNSEMIYYVYVLNDERKLLGVVTLRDLILAPRYRLIRDVMSREVVQVQGKEDREDVAEKIARYDLLAIPVVDEDGRLVGIVTHDDVMDVVVQEATEDLHRMGGVGTFEQSYLDSSFVTIWRTRAMWLACLFGAELFTFTALAYFEDAIKTVVVLSLFIPLCISTGGNSGSQAATLITRAMALGQVGAKDWLRVLRHELLMGIVLGLTLGAIGFLRGAFTPHEVLAGSEERKDAFEVIVPADKSLSLQPNGSVTLPAGAAMTPPSHLLGVTLPQGKEMEEREVKDSGYRSYRFPENSSLTYKAATRWELAIVIAQAVAAICLWGTLVGSMLPMVFKRFGVDPAYAASPFVATFVDVTGILIYFTIAKIWIPAISL